MCVLPYKYRKLLDVLEIFLEVMRRNGEQANVSFRADAAIATLYTPKSCTNTPGTPLATTSGATTTVATTPLLATPLLTTHPATTSATTLLTQRHSYVNFTPKNTQSTTPVATSGAPKLPTQRHSYVNFTPKNKQPVRHSYVNYRPRSKSGSTLLDTRQVRRRSQPLPAPPSSSSSSSSSRPFFLPRSVYTRQSRFACAFFHIRIANTVNNWKGC